MDEKRKEEVELKNKAENTSGNGDGIVYAKAMASGFVEESTEKTLEDIQSPEI